MLDLLQGFGGFWSGRMPQGRGIRACMDAFMASLNGSCRALAEKRSSFDVNSAQTFRTRGKYIPVRSAPASLLATVLKVCAKMTPGSAERTAVGGFA